MNWCGARARFIGMKQTTPFSKYFSFTSSACTKLKFWPLLSVTILRQLAIVLGSMVTPALTITFLSSITPFYSLQFSPMTTLSQIKLSVHSQLSRIVTLSHTRHLVSFTFYPILQLAPITEFYISQLSPISVPDPMARLPEIIVWRPLRTFSPMYRLKGVFFIFDLKTGNSTVKG